MTIRTALGKRLWELRRRIVASGARLLSWDDIGRDHVDDSRESIYGGMMTEKLQSFRPVSPGEILKEELEARGWTPSDLATLLGRSIQVANEIISGEKAISPAIAADLSYAIGTSSEFWLNLESSYRSRKT